MMQKKNRTEMKKKLVRILSLTLALVMVFTTAVYLQPGEDNVTYAAGGYKEVSLGNFGRIGNGGYSAESISGAFNNVSGMTYTEIGQPDCIDFQAGTGTVHHNAVARLSINIAQNDMLKRLAQGGASITISGKTKYVNEKQGADSDHFWAAAQVMVIHNGSIVAQTITEAEIADGKGLKADKGQYWRWYEQLPAGLGAYGCNKCHKENSYSTTRNFSVNDTFEIWLFCSTSNNGSSSAGAEFTVDVTITESTCPTASYSMGFSGGETSTDQNGTPQMLMKLDNPNQYIDLDMNFSEPVYPDETLEQHTLFTNVPGTGFPRQGDPEYLLPVTNLRQWNRSIKFRYNVQRGAYSGSAVLYGGRIETAPSGDVSFIQKIKNADFHDTAGNPLQISNNSGQNKFDTADGGYNVYVDAMPPTYTKTGNGITPDILTGVTLNKGDSFDFVVTFSEMTRVVKGLDQSKTYLMLSNGDRAYFKETANNGKQWIFSYAITDESADTSLLKVIALTNEAYDDDLNENATGSSIKANLSGYTIDVDARCLVDFTGNGMTDYANEDATTNEDQIESSIQWADISIDNTDPEIDFSYSPYSPMMTVPTEDPDTEGKAGAWGQAGKIFVQASDPEIPTPQYDPDQSLDAYMSKGIYRPDTGAGDGGAGLIYYVWSDSPTAPDTGEYFEVIKRYSLAGWDDYASDQMNTEGTPYASWKRLSDMGLTLTLANNYSDIVPPKEFLTSAYSGKWYLHVWTADMTWDSARQLMQYDMTRGLKYNTDPDTGKVYTAAGLSAHRAELAEAQMKLGKTAQQAMDLTLETYYSDIYTTDYIALLNESGKTWTSADAENYARYKSMEMAGDYGNINLWTPEEFRQDDSNWILRTAEIALDNTMPEGIFLYDSVTGDNTGNVRVPFTLSDGHSGINTESIFYQWVKKPSDAGDTRPESTTELEDIDWLKVSPAAIEYSAQTLTAEVYAETKDDENITDGDYYLSVKFTDNAGNEVILHSQESVTVNSQVNTACEFSQEEEEADYYSTVTPTFHVTGLKIGEVKYAVGDSARRPADEAFTVISSCGETDTDFDRFYQIPSMGSIHADGTWYVHVMITEATPDAKPTHFYSTYRLDNTAPSVSISPDGGAIARAEYQVSLNVSDALSGADPAGIFYEWTQNPSANTFEDGDWTATSAKTKISRKITDPQQSGTWYLHVIAKDRAGNTRAVSSEGFTFFLERRAEIKDYSSRLLAVSTEGSKLKGIAELILEEEDKAGFRYSVTTNGGKTWSSWQPYRSMIEMTLPVDSAAELAGLAEGTLAVRFRSPYGDVGQTKPIGTVLPESEGPWATADLDSMTAKMSGKQVTILMNIPEGVTAAAIAEKNPAAITEDEGDFVVQTNGAYCITLTKGEESCDFFFVVDIYDDVKPEGLITYSETDRTAGSVTAMLETSEPVNVKKIILYDSEGAKTGEAAGKDRYTFSGNGKAEFIFADAAGNENKKTAVVRNIDHEAPDVIIETLYSNGKGREYATAENGQGETISRGLFLSLAKKKGGNGKDFTVISGDQSTMIEVTKNGVYSFTVCDDFGNTAVLKTTVSAIAEEEITPIITYRYASEENAGLDPAENFLADSVTATISFKAPADGRAVYAGAAWKSGAQPLTLKDGYYVYEHTYSGNGSKTVCFNDGLGGRTEAVVTITGIDTTKPEITLSSSFLMLQLAESDLPLTGRALEEALGGYVTDDRENPDAVTVTLTDLTGTPAAITGTGTYTIRYKATDPAGNEAYADQTVYVIGANDLYVTASGQPLMTGGNSTAIIPTNRVTFMIDRDCLQQMFYQGKKAYNRRMRYDVYYVSGLYREGQMKYVGTKLTGEQLTSQAYTITFDKPGWYTIIIRNQERNRVFTSFFVSSVE